MMMCTCSREQFKIGEMPQSPESFATRDFSASGFSSRTGDGECRPDNGNIEEAESSLREGFSLNYEEARALLGRLEYQRGNIEAALYVFEGIDTSSIIPKMRSTIASRGHSRKGRLRGEIAPAMSMHAVNLLLEAVYLKAKALQDLGRPREAAQECKIVLDTVESALLQGMPEGIARDCKLHETVSKSVELLPELWKQEGSIPEAMAAYRRALLNPWGLDSECSGRIQKEFAIMLLYGGVEAGPPSLGSQVEGSYIPKNNTEEAILLLLILLRKFALKKIPWDPTIMEHLTFALSTTGQFGILANQVEELIPRIYNRTDRWYTLALCYSAGGQDEVALNLLKKSVGRNEKPDFIPALLLASKISCESSNQGNGAVIFAKRALENLGREGHCMKCVANGLLGSALGKQSKLALSDTERAQMQYGAVIALEKAVSTENGDPKMLMRLCLENAEQRNLNVALDYARKLLEMEGGMSIKAWRLLALILSAQQKHSEAETVIDAALDQTGKWEQGKLLRTKAKLQTAHAKSKDAIKTYGRLLALVQAQKKSFGTGNWKLKGWDDRDLELEAWQDLAYVYIGLEQWQDAGICVQRANALKPHSAQTWHATGVLYQAQILHNQALNAFSYAMAIDPENVPSMISTAEILRQQGEIQSLPVARALLTDALKLDKTNHKTWFNLGMVHKMEGRLQESAECFQASYLLELSNPVESFSSV
ncbi:hypothetical protein KI387_032029 [Taxus chinensis]|uniref:Uncharacterized protein n=1 Tax=Taxus chinensis TaxID=29808 RepID=A0AA38BQW7_TAXCH|nr:hypothetical protein KI387_032029 [Taxus chinensis]